MPGRELVRELRISSELQTSPDKPAQMQAQTVFENVSIPKWMIQNRRGRRVAAR